MKGVPLRRDSAARSKGRREGGTEGGLGGEREESTPKSLSVASYREVVPLQLAKIRQTLPGQGSHQILPLNLLLECPR